MAILVLQCVTGAYRHVHRVRLLFIWQDLLPQCNAMTMARTCPDGKNLSRWQELVTMAPTLDHSKNLPLALEEATSFGLRMATDRAAWKDIDSDGKRGTARQHANDVNVKKGDQPTDSNHKACFC